VIKLVWELISKQITEKWEYKTKGKGYVLIFSYDYDANIDKWFIGDIRVIVNNKKVYNFLNLENLNKFLTKRGIPSFQESMIVPIQVKK
jgi:hypothetical protein